MTLNKVVDQLEYSLIRILKEKASEYDDVIDLTIGEPDLPVPKTVVKETLEYAEKNHLPYAPTGGGIEIREKIANYYNTKYGGNYSRDNIIMHIGASEALSSVLKTVLNPEDEVIVPAPYYPGYIPMIKLAYGVPVIADTRESNFILTDKILEKYITDKTKAIVLSNPCNPSGTVMSKNEIKKIANFLKDRNIFLIVDEIYNMLSFYDYNSFAQCDEIREKTIIINGFSKSHSMTGWRLGYSIVPLALRRNFLNATLYNVSSPMTLSLVAGEIAIDKFPTREDLVETYKERAIFLKNGLEKLGFSVIEPKGAFYLFVNYSKISDKSSLDFAMELLEKAKVAVVPGVTFGTEKFFRIALTQDISILKNALENFNQYVRDRN